MSRTYNRIRRFYWWPTIRSDVKKFIQQCIICKQTKITRHTKMPIQIASAASKPFETIFIDTVGPINPPSEDGNSYIFTCECDLSKFGIAIAIPDISAMTVAQTLLREVLLKYKIPEKIIMDNGSCFTSELFTSITKLMNVKNKFIAPYNPKTNLVERLHRTLNQYLRAFTSDDRDNWDRYLHFAMHSYNNTPQQTTGFAPHELVYGFVNPIPTKILKNDNPIYNYDNFTDELRMRLKHSHKLAKEKIDEAKKKNESDWNQKIRPINVDIDDEVFIRNRNKNHKFDNEYDGPFKVIERPSPTTVKIKKGRRLFTVHMDHIIKSPNT